MSEDRPAEEQDFKVRTAELPHKTRRIGFHFEIDRLTECLQKPSLYSESLKQLTTVGDKLLAISSSLHTLQEWTTELTGVPDTIPLLAQIIHSSNGILNHLEPNIVEKTFNPLHMAEQIVFDLQSLLKEPAHLKRLEDELTKFSDGLNLIAFDGEEFGIMTEVLTRNGWTEKGQVAKNSEDAEQKASDIPLKETLQAAMRSSSPIHTSPPTKNQKLDLKSVETETFKLSGT